MDMKGNHTPLQIGLLLAMACLATAGAAARPLPLWEIEGSTNRIFLLGSAHMLRPADYPLPAAIEEAYSSADALVMEIDMDSMDPAEAQSIMASLGTNGTELSASIGAASYAEAEELAQAAGIELAEFTPFEPWLAALMISQFRVMQLGFDPALGVEMQIGARAQADGKEISGLETFAEQLGFMDQLDIATQRLFLLESLKDNAEIREELQATIDAWRSGDMETLAKMQLEMAQEAPNLYDALFTRRNRNWVPQIIDLTGQQKDYLVIVGTMHLAGAEGLPALLKAKGLKVRQLSDSSAD